MKRTRIELTDIAERGNLVSALHKAQMGKRNRTDVSAFVINMDEELNQLAGDILSGRMPDGGYREFLIRDPKQRRIHAAPFRDRVFHHALMNLAGPVLERAMTPMSYACRPVMGVHRAITQVQLNLRRYRCYGKIDIDGYFPAIDHARLYELLVRRFKGGDIANQFSRIIDGYHTRPGVGLPIGSLTSQYFANYYLDAFDRWLAAHPAVHIAVRYMDDIIWWCDERSDVRRVLDEATDWLIEMRCLRVKAGAQVQQSACGVSYCGARISQGTKRLSRRKQRGYRSRKAYWEAQFRKGEISATQLQTAYASVLAVTEQCDSLAWRRSVESRFPTGIEV